MQDYPDTPEKKERKDNLAELDRKETQVCVQTQIFYSIRVIEALMEPKESQEPQDQRENKGLLDTKDTKVTVDLQELQDSQVLWDQEDSQDPKEIREKWGPSDS
uniref:Uncharacterized protein n=1 Tax=Cacopsylla melanoneura TaxID=428564 RepID=A0A8D9C2W0_9HEMI